MKKITTVFAATTLALLGATQGALADDHSCVFEKDPLDFTDADIDALYTCVADDLAAGYAREGHAVGSVYRTWSATATRPYNPGVHGARFLNTFVNDIGAEQYLKYDFGDDLVMPVGSVLAKEMFSLRDTGEPRPAALLIMTKIAAGGEAEAFGNWVYAGVQPNGKPMGVSQSFCHECHQAFADQDNMGYPDPSVRLTSN